MFNAQSWKEPKTTESMREGQRAASSFKQLLIITTTTKFQTDYPKRPRPNPYFWARKTDSSNCCYGEEFSSFADDRQSGAVSHGHGENTQGLGSCTFLLCFAWLVASIASSFSEENAKSILYYFETKQ